MSEQILSERFVHPVSGPRWYRKTCSACGSWVEEVVRSEDNDSKLLLIESEGHAKGCTYGKSS